MSFLWIKNNNKKTPLKIIETLTSIRTHRLFFGGFRWEKKKEREKRSGYTDTYQAAPIQREDHVRMEQTRESLR